MEKPLLIVGDDACSTHGIAPAGIEGNNVNASFSRRKTGVSQPAEQGVVLSVVPSEAIDTDLRAIIDVWPTLPGETRKAILDMIRKQQLAK